MKKINLIGVLMLAATSLLFIQCTSDPIAGPPGANGTDGLDGIDGVDGSAASCIACHSNTHREPIYESYELSFHAKGLEEGAVNYAGARASCAQCHSNEGYVDYITRGFVNPAGYYGLSEPELVINDNGTPDDPSDDYPELDEYGVPIYSNNPVPNVSPISCTTCHGVHKSFDFENDGNDYALRGLDPITLITDDSYVIDYGDGSNACASCHQPRRTGPTDDGSGNFFISSSHWGPHHGPQVTMLEGIQGILIPGSEAYPGIASAAHRTGSTCVSCHMSETTDGSDGLHTMLPTENACTTCHDSGIPPTDFLAADMDHLGELLEAAGALHYDGEAWHPVRGTVPIAVAEAAWNFLFVYEDMSGGVHNPDYAKALIKNSIEALE